MPTPAAILTELASRIATLTGGTRSASDYREDFEAIPAGGTRFQLRGMTSGVARNSNLARPQMALRLDVHHRLGASETERQWTEDEMQTHLASLLDPDWWRVAGYVYDVPQSQDVGANPSADTEDVRREDNVISYTVTLVVVTVP